MTLVHEWLSMRPDAIERVRRTLVDVFDGFRGINCDWLDIGTVYPCTYCGAVDWLMSPVHVCRVPG